MKNWFLIPLAAIVGVVVGSWSSREDLARYKEKVQAERTEKRVSGATGFDAFAKLANIPEVAKPRRIARTNELARTKRPSAATGAAGVAQNGYSDEDVLNDDNEPTAVWISSQGSREDLQSRLEEAANIWNARVELAKAQWKAKLGISGEASAAFDSAVDSMNESLRGTMEALAVEIEKAGKVNTELGLRMMGDLSQGLAETYDAIGALVPAERRGEVSEMPVHEFIDPMVAEPLIGVQDKLDSGFRTHGENR